MARITLRTLRRLHELVSLDRVVLTQKALEELDELPELFERSDVLAVLANLTREDCAQRTVSKRTQEWLYIFKASRLGLHLYIKVVLREDCMVIPFHEDR
jgi:hypothetical protein